MNRLFFLTLFIALISGCGFLDDELLLSDDEYNDSFGVGGLGLSGYGTGGCGCGGGSYSWGHGHSHYTRVWRKWRKKHLRVDYRDPTTDVNWSTAGTVPPQESDDGEETEKFLDISPEDIQRGVEMYLEAGYEVRVIALDDPSVEPDEQSVSVLIY